MDGNKAAPVRDDLAREVYCILGIPVDAIEMPAVLRSIELAAANSTPFVISTPNLNFLVNSQTDPDFRESLLVSDLCPPDGMPIIWIARLLGIPIKKRIAGSDMLEALKSRPDPEQPLKVFLFGAMEQVAAAASARLNCGSISLRCVGWACPGFVNVDELSADRFINEINASGADFLVAALGAKKGQLWLLRNHSRLRIPVRAHLGATINFHAGTVKRAPSIMQTVGLEWLWRIKEEPALFRRYWDDGWVFIRLLLTRVLPLAVSARWMRLRAPRRRHDFVIVQDHNPQSVRLGIRGDATGGQVAKAIVSLREAVAGRKAVIIDLSQTGTVDARFFGLLLMLRKKLIGNGCSLQFVGASPVLKRLFRLNGLHYLLSSCEHYNVNPVN